MYSWYLEQALMLHSTVELILILIFRFRPNFYLTIETKAMLFFVCYVVSFMSP